VKNAYVVDFTLLDGHWVFQLLRSELPYEMRLSN